MHMSYFMQVCVHKFTVLAMYVFQCVQSSLYCEASFRCKFGVVGVSRYNFSRGKGAEWQLLLLLFVFVHGVTLMLFTPF